MGFPTLKEREKFAKLLKDFSWTDDLFAELDGKEMKIAMNGKYILDALKALTEEKVVLSFNSSVSPFTVENEEDKRCQYLVLPVRTGAAS